MEGENNRKTEHKIDEIFWKRWSPRSMTGEGVLESELMSMLEAARWAPSSFNEQPWRFIYAKNGTSSWEPMFSLLGDFNKEWCKKAGYLVCLITRKNFTHHDKPNRNHMSDAGAAWMNFALQASMKGFVVHGMAGFDVEKARTTLGIPDEYEIVHMFAVGVQGSPNDLPEEMKKSESPNDRKKVSEFAFEGKFRN